MPKCKKCDASFKTRVVINNKERRLNNRKYCLECSPFGQHNTKKLETEDSGCICQTCKKSFTYKRGHNSHIKCSSCMVNNRRFKKRQDLLDYKGGKCQICDYDKCISGLSFHHVDPLTKNFTIGGNYNRKWKDLIKEADKCILVCHNCHAEIHYALKA